MAIKKWFYAAQDQADTLIKEAGYEKISVCNYQVISPNRVIESWHVIKGDDPERKLLEAHYLLLASDTINITLFELKLAATKNIYKKD